VKLLRAATRVKTDLGLAGQAKLTPAADATSMGNGLCMNTMTETRSAKPRDITIPFDVIASALVLTLDQGCIGTPASELENSWSSAVRFLENA
jgi:hypothetical protein